MTVRTRFAPSPTGVLHIGSVRTALFCWLYAKGRDGQFVLRIEDTDRARSTDENVEAILDGMKWLGLDWDEGPIFQTERFARYAEVAQELLERGKAYHCYCSREELDALREQQMKAGEKTRYDGRCRNRTEPAPGVEPVVRFKNPVDGDVVVEDLVRGEVRFSNEELDDLIIVRSDGTPTYNFTVIIDDSDMQISHVIRGDDHLNNTPRQVNMLRALGVEAPKYAHLPMIHGADGGKLSKRHGAVDVREYRDAGYLPEALLNYLGRLGWSHGNQEIFSISEMVDLFDISNVNTSASVFNPEKLRWLNQQHIIASPAAALADRLAACLSAIGLDPSNGPAPDLVVEGFRERAETLVEMAESARYCYEDFDTIDAAAAKKHLRPVVLEPMLAVREKLAGLKEWNAQGIADALQETVDSFDMKLGKLGQPLRVAVTGTPISPPIDVTIFLVGRERSLQRIDSAIEVIRERLERQNQ